MGSPDQTRGRTKFAEFILDVDVYRRMHADRVLPVEHEAERELIAQALAGLFEKAAGKCGPVEVAIFRSGGIRGQDGEAPLPSGPLWGFQLFVRSEPLLERSGDVLPLVRPNKEVVGTR